MLRYASSGSAPLEPAWKRKAEAFYGVAMQNGYGLTEITAGHCAAKNEIGDPDISVGPRLPGTDVVASKLNVPHENSGMSLFPRKSMRVSGHGMGGYARAI